MAKTYRIKNGFDESLERLRIGMIIKTKESVTEAEILHALLLKYLKKITPRDVLMYRNWLDEMDEGVDPADLAQREEEERMEEYLREQDEMDEASNWPDEPIE